MAENQTVTSFGDEPIEIIEGGTYLCGMFCVRRRVTKIERGFWPWQKRVWFTTELPSGDICAQSSTLSQFKRTVRGRAYV
jgi:hypothetical protein